jgi:RND family efflux transporter MFP subunit
MTSPDEPTTPSQPAAVAAPPTPALHKASRLSSFISTMAVCGVLLGAAWWLMSSQHHKAEEHAGRHNAPSDPIAITVESVTPRVVQRSVSVVGSLYGQEEIVIRPKVGGRVAEILHETGDRVSTGDVLLRVEQTEYELAAAEARRSLELELTKLGLKQLPGDDFDPAQLPSVVRARVEEQNALSRLNRVRELSKRQVLSGEELESAETNYTVARANSQQMRLDAHSLLATAQQRQSVLNTALQRLGETEIIVPGPGSQRSKSSAGHQEYVVADRSVAVGEMLSTTPGSDPGVFKLVIDHPLKLVTTLPERHRSEIKLGQSVELHVEYSPGKTFAGTVARINPVVDRASRTFEVEIMVPNEDRQLSAGSFVRATVSTHVDEHAPTVPEQALVKMAGVTKVFVVRDGIVHEVQVKPQGQVTVAGSRYSESWIEIDGNLPAQSMVVTSGFSQLSDGSAVRIRPAGVVAAREQESHP